MTFSTVDITLWPALDNIDTPLVPIEFIGDQRGSVSYRNPVTNRVIRPSAFNRYWWVLDEDVAFYLRRPEFLVHSDARVEPVRERERMLAARLAEIEALLQVPTEEKAVSMPASARTGRPRTPDEDNLYVWHLKQHHEWMFPEIAVHLGMDESSAGALSARLRRWPERSAAPSVDECQHCAVETRPPSRNHRD